MTNGQKLKNALDLASTVAVIVAASALVWTIVSGQSSRPRRTLQLENVSDLTVRAEEIRHSVGSGPVTIIEFSDFQCPFCLRHIKDTMPSLERDYLQPGTDVRYAALHLPLVQIHSLAFQAAEAAECAGKQNYFWTMRRLLFSQPMELAREDLVRHANDLGLNFSQFVACLDGHEMENSVRADTALAQRLGVTATPVFFIGLTRQDGDVALLRRINGIVSVDVFAQEIARLRLQGPS